MKALIVKLVLFFLLAAGVAKCGDKNNLIMVGFERTMTESQIDSLCQADTLDANIDNWMQAGFVDYETGAVVTKYSFIKELKDSTEIIYIITYSMGEYNVMKRVVKVE